MSSKLFHTIVAVGITLGAAACAASEPQTSSDENAITAAADNAGADKGAIVNAFCDAAWPTTKGGTARPLHSTPACVDPTNACANAGDPFPCAEPQNFGCNVSVCVEGAWQCKKPEQVRVPLGVFGACDGQSSATDPAPATN